MKESDEFSILQKYFKNLGSQFLDSSGILIGPGDDAGLFKNSNEDLIFSTDVSHSDIHFPKKLDPELIAYRACSVAASDIAACGGALKWLSISLVTPSKELSWLAKFAKGISLFTKDYRVPVLGGDLSRGKECSVSVGVCGEVKKKYFLSRSGAKLGDSIYVSGFLGFSRIGLEIVKSKKNNLSAKEKRYKKKYLKPKVNLSLGQELRKIANSCIDISDGLIGDLGHICEQSKVGAEIDIELIPYEGTYKNALTWGDDYELCFTVPKSKEKKIKIIEDKLKMKLYKIGEIIKINNIRIKKGDLHLKMSQKSYNHFK